MPAVTIGPCRIADVDGTHEPGAVIENPSQALVDLAEAKMADPETGLPYASATADVPTPAPAPEPAVEPTPEPTPPAEEAAP